MGIAIAIFIALLLCAMIKVTRTTVALFLLLVAILAVVG